MTMSGYVTAAFITHLSLYKTCYLIPIEDTTTLSSIGEYVRLKVGCLASNATFEYYKLRNPVELLELDRFDLYYVGWNGDPALVDVADKVPQETFASDFVREDEMISLLLREPITCDEKSTNLLTNLCIEKWCQRRYGVGSDDIYTYHDNRLTGLDFSVIGFPETASQLNFEDDYYYVWRVLSVLPSSTHVLIDAGDPSSGRRDVALRIDTDDNTEGVTFYFHHSQAFKMNSLASIPFDYGAGTSFVLLDKSMDLNKIINTINYSPRPYANPGMTIYIFKHLEYTPQDLPITTRCKIEAYKYPTGVRKYINSTRKLERIELEDVAEQ